MFSHKGEAGARQNPSRRPLENAIELSFLCEVGNFRRAAVISNRRQKIVLEHRAQSYIRTETFRFVRAPIGEFVRGVFLVWPGLDVILGVVRSRQRVARASLIA